MSDTRTKSGLGTIIGILTVVGVASVIWSVSSSEESPTKTEPTPARERRVYVEVKVNNDTAFKIDAYREAPPGGAPQSIGNHMVSRAWVWSEIVPANEQVKFVATGEVKNARRRGTLSCKIDVNGKHVIPEKRVIFRPDGGKVSVTCSITV